MTYREIDVVEVQPEVDNLPSHATIQILNGTTMEITVPCSYVIPAVAPATEDTIVPIHLTAEGYTTVVVAFASAPDGLSATAEIDAVDDSIVKIVFSSQCASAVSADVECETSVLASRGAGATLRTDCVLQATVEIKAAPIIIVVP